MGIHREVCRGDGGQDIRRSCGGKEKLDRGSGGLAENFIGHYLRVCWAAQGHGMEVGTIEFTVDLANLNLAERDRLLLAHTIGRRR